MKRVNADIDIDRLETLVDELSKQKPEPGRVKSCMKKAGLGYSEDPIQQLATVLEALEGKTTAAARVASPAHKAPIKIEGES